MESVFHWALLSPSIEGLKPKRGRGKGQIMCAAPASEQEYWWAWTENRTPGRANVVESGVEEENWASHKTALSKRRTGKSRQWGRSETGDWHSEHHPLNRVGCCQGARAVGCWRYAQSRLLASQEAWMHFALCQCERKAVAEVMEAQK